MQAVHYEMTSQPSAAAYQSDNQMRQHTIMFTIKAVRLVISTKIQKKQTKNTGLKSNQSICLQLSICWNPKTVDNDVDKTMKGLKRKMCINPDVMDLESETSSPLLSIL